MNKKQKITILVAIGALALLTLFPPMGNYHSGYGGYRAPDGWYNSGRGFLFLMPGRGRIDLRGVFLQYFFVALVATPLWWFFRDPKKD